MRQGSRWREGRRRPTPVPHRPWGMAMSQPLKQTSCLLEHMPLKNTQESTGPARPYISGGHARGSPGGPSSCLRSRWSQNSTSAR